MTDLNDALNDGDEPRFEVTDGGKLVENDDHEDAEFEEDLTFEDG